MTYDCVTCGGNPCECFSEPMTPGLVERLRGLGKWEVQRRPATATELLAEAADRIEALEVAIVQAREALERADQFITNGIEFGYIRMPDADTPDSAHETPRVIRQALSALDRKG